MNPNRSIRISNPTAAIAGYLAAYRGPSAFAWDNANGGKMNLADNVSAMLAALPEVQTRQIFLSCLTSGSDDAMDNCALAGIRVGMIERERRIESASPPDLGPQGAPQPATQQEVTAPAQADVQIRASSEDPPDLDYACSKGNSAEACFLAAQPFEKKAEGISLLTDDEVDKLMYYLKKSCLDLSLGKACTALGNEFLTGRNVQSNLSEALAAFRKGCSLGAASSCEYADTTSKKIDNFKQGDPGGTTPSHRCPSGTMDRVDMSLTHHCVYY